jgi:hypothetical protein
MNDCQILKTVGFEIIPPIYDGISGRVRGPLQLMNSRRILERDRVRTCEEED